MSFFRISARILSIIVVYLALVYTTVYVFEASANTDSFAVVVPQVAVSHTEITQDSINATINSGYGLLGAIFGAIVVGLAVFATFVSGGTLAPLIAVAYTAGGAVSGAVAGYSVGYTVSAVARASHVELPFDDFAFGLQAFFGSILDLFIFLVSFLSFGLISDAVLGIPREFSFLLFFMTFPVWIYFVTIIAGFAVEAWKSIKTAIT